MPILLLVSCHPILDAPCTFHVPNGEQLPAEVREAIAWRRSDPNTSSERPEPVVEKLEGLGWTCWGRSGNNVCRMWQLSKGRLRGVVNSPAPRHDWFKAPEDCPGDDVDWAPAEMRQIVSRRNIRQRALQPINRNKN